MGDPDPARAKRASEAVYSTMGKIDIAAIEAAPAESPPRRAEPRQEPIFGGKGSSPAFHGPGL
jgi:hypothetical protein